MKARTVLALVVLLIGYSVGFVGESKGQTAVQDYNVTYFGGPSNGANVKFRIEYPTVCFAGQTFDIFIVAQHILGSTTAFNIVLQFTPSPSNYISIADPSGSDTISFGTLGADFKANRQFRFAVSGNAPERAGLQIRMDTSATSNWQTLSPDLTCTLGTTTPPQPPTFSLSVSQGVLQLRPGQTGQVAIQVSVSPSWPPGQTISLSATSSAPGVIPSISPSSLSGSGSATLTITTSSATSAGAYQVTILASSGGTPSQSGTVSVLVEEQEPPAPWWATTQGQVGIITVVGVVAVLGIIMITRRRQRPPPARLGPVPTMPPLYGPPKPAGPTHRPQVVEVKKKESS